MIEASRQIAAPRYRETCLATFPTVYDVAPCRHCGGKNITWSEFKDFLWCFDCEVDYYPDHWGVLDGPIPTGLASLLGMTFDRIGIATGRLMKFNPETCGYDVDAA